MKKKNAFIRFITNRTFWIQAGTIVSVTANEIMPIVPREYVFGVGIGLTLLNRLLKAAKEVKE